MTYITVVNLATGEQKLYTCPPLDAVIAAHAQSLGDFNTWDYLPKYRDQVETTRLGHYIGDWGVIHSPTVDLPKIAWVAENLTKEV